MLYCLVVGKSGVYTHVLGCLSAFLVNDILICDPVEFVTPGL